MSVDRSPVPFSLSDASGPGSQHKSTKRSRRHGDVEDCHCKGGGAMRLLKLAIALLSIWPLTAEAGSVAALYESGNRLYYEGKYQEAEPILRRAVERGRRELKPGSVEMQKMLNTLGTLFYFQGRFGEAEPLLKQAIAIGERSPGRPETIISLSQLANVYRTRGPSDEAEPLLRRAVELAQKDLDPDNPLVATPLYLLAVTLSDQNRCSEGSAAVGSRGAPRRRRQPDFSGGSCKASRCEGLSRLRMQDSLPGSAIARRRRGKENQ